MTVRVRPWSYNPDIAHMLVFSHGRRPSVGDLERWFTSLRRLGFRSLRTGACAEVEWGLYTASGCEVAQHLVVLARPTDTPLVPVTSAHVTLRTMRRRDLDSVAAVDQAAFSDAWALDRWAIVDACRATPKHHACSAWVDGELVGFAVSGDYAAAHSASGYLQRLAVHPRHQGRGIGTALVRDAVSWSVRCAHDRMLVNTQDINTAALRLYEQHDFADTRGPLRMFQRSLA
jgi:ribosomal protein S18 acetylase RimI-like enzyme